jgi:ketosteroid isomerase-like protein
MEVPLRSLRQFSAFSAFQDFGSGQSQGRNPKTQSSQRTSGEYAQEDRRRFPCFTWFKIAVMRSPTLSFVLAALIILSGCTVYAEHPVKSFTQATGGEGFERALWKEIQAQDWKDVNAHFASNFVYITPAGRWDRSGALEQIQKLRLQDYTISDLSTEMNRDTFVVTYTIALHGTGQSGALSSAPERRMTVWQQQKSGWLAIAHSVLAPAQP